MLTHSLHARIRGYSEKKIPAKPTVTQPSVKTKAVELPNRPRNQRSLADFSSSNKDKQKDKWWKPVLDGTINHSREEEIKSAEAANIEVVANSLENEAHTPIVIDHREANSTLPAMLKLHGHNVTMQSLAIGDIRISDRVLIERKPLETLSIH